jgi:hypothetical protein
VWLGFGLTLTLAGIGLIFEIRFIEPWRVRLAKRPSELKPSAIRITPGTADA